MILAIRSDSDEAQLFLLVSDGSIKKQKKWQAGRELSKQLLKEIKSLVGSFNSLKGIIVYKGPGSFTGLRIGISVANSIAYGQNIPVVGTTSAGWLANGVDLLKKQNSGKFIMPEYGAAPNITKPKK